MKNTKRNKKHSHLKASVATVYISKPRAAFRMCPESNLKPPNGELRVEVGGRRRRRRGQERNELKKEEK